MSRRRSSVQNQPVISFRPLTKAARQAHVLEETSHRPWPLPDAQWVQAQTREDVLFAHWRVALDELARVLPPGVALDTHDGDAWLGLVPYRVTNLRLRGLPALPRGFPMLEVRTYVTVDGRPGSWLASLDAASALLAEAAKRVHRLPAYKAQMSAASDTLAHGYTCTKPTVRFESRRDGLSFRAAYGPDGEEFTCAPGTLEHFLTERYCIYTADGGRLYRAELHHAPWRLQPAAAEIEEVTLAPVPIHGEPHLAYAGAQDLLVWPLEEL
jgi:uncharacterized protein YqjF (DUF2071 family)